MANIKFLKSVETVLGACAALKNSELASAVLAEAEHLNSDKDICGEFIKVFACREEWDMALKVYEHSMIQANPDPVIAEVLNSGQQWSTVD